MHRLLLKIKQKLLQKNIRLIDKLNQEKLFKNRIEFMENENK